MYIGRVIWNKRQWLKDPDTGKRRYVERPRAEWLVREDESLRIVPAELWQRARRRERRCPARGGRTGKGRTPSTLLGGMLRCHTCGGPVIGINRLRYGASARRRRRCGSGSAALAKPAGEITRLVDAVAATGITGTLAARLRVAEAEREELEARLSSAQTPARVTIEDVLGRYRRLVTQLHRVLAEKEDRARTLSLIHI